MYSGDGFLLMIGLCRFECCFAGYCLMEMGHLGIYYRTTCIFTLISGWAVGVFRMLSIRK